MIHQPVSFQWFTFEATQAACASSKISKIAGIWELEILLMNEPKNESPNVSAQPGQGPATTAQKVRSSRYEWEGRSGNEDEKAAGASGASRRSVLASARALLKRFFSGNCGPENRGFFDNDDDASPSARPKRLL
jgi:hypothetical protein